MLRTIIISVASLAFALTVSAQEQDSSAFQKLYNHYYELYEANDTGAFYNTSHQIQNYFLERHDMTLYYRTRQEEIRYESEHGQAYKAIMDARELLEEMKENGDNQFGIVYRALGNIFESRGNYGMAVYYYQEALNNIAPADSAELADTYGSMVSANVTRYPEKAQEWCDLLASVITPDSPKYPKYLTLKGFIYFQMGEKAKFLSAKRELDEFSRVHHTTRGNAYRAILTLMEKAFTGRYNEARELLDKVEENGYDPIKICNVRIRIYEMMGRPELALRETDKRRSLRDSLYNDLIFNNINEVNAAAGVIKLNEQAAKAAKERELWMTIAIGLLVVALGLMVSRYFVRRQYQRKLLKQNELLEIALDESKEADRMKSSFINHITHEIRTPLNILTGYIHIIADSGYELSKEDRDELLAGIDQNTFAITSIVNDLLEVSQSESKERYRRDEQIVINDFCRNIMREKEGKNLNGLNLEFHTDLPDDFVISSNYRGIERVLRQLLGNALKFTKQGRVELAVDESADKSAIRFTVTDTGIGIPEEHHEHVFENFYKVDSFRQGLGIGLPMSRKIAHLLGGSLVIDKTYREGTRMIFTIPVIMDEDE